MSLDTLIWSTRGARPCSMPTMTWGGDLETSGGRFPSLAGRIMMQNRQSKGLYLEIVNQPSTVSVLVSCSTHLNLNFGYWNVKIVDFMNFQFLQIFCSLTSLVPCKLCRTWVYKHASVTNWLIILKVESRVGRLEVKNK